MENWRWLLILSFNSSPQLKCVRFMIESRVKQHSLTEIKKIMFIFQIFNKRRSLWLLGNWFSFLNYRFSFFLDTESSHPDHVHHKDHPCVHYEVAHTVNQQNLQLPLFVFYRALAHCLAFQPTTLHSRFTITALIHRFQPQRAAVFSQKALKTHCMLPSQRRTAGTVRDWLVKH